MLRAIRDVALMPTLLRDCLHAAYARYAGIADDDAAAVMLTPLLSLFYAKR